MDSGFIKDNVLPTIERNSENHILQHNTVHNNNKNHVLFWSGMHLVYYTTI